MANLGNGVIFLLSGNTFLTSSNNNNTVNSNIVFFTTSNTQITTANTGSQIDTGIIIFSTFNPTLTTANTGSQIDTGIIIFSTFNPTLTTVNTAITGNTYLPLTTGVITSANSNFELIKNNTLYGNSNISTANTRVDLLNQEINKSFKPPNFTFRRL